MHDHLVAAMVLLALIMVLNLESWKSRLAYLAVVLLSFASLSALQAAISVIAMTLTLILYVAVTTIQKNARLQHSAEATKTHHYL